MHNQLTMRYPSARQGEMWREAAPFGSGLIGGLVYGGVMKEIIALNHALLWMGGKNAELPDVSACLPEIRRLLDQHNSPDADLVLGKALEQAGYDGDTVRPCPVCDLNLQTLSAGNFAHYRREIRMDRAEVTVHWQDGETSFRRSVFASRENHLVFTRFTVSGGQADLRISLSVHDRETMPRGMELPGVSASAEGDTLYFAAENRSVYRPGDFGAVCRVFTDGELRADGDALTVRGASSILTVTGLFVETPRRQAFRQLRDRLNGSFDYDACLAAHAALHGALWSGVDFSLGEKGDSSNEELLLQAFEEHAPNELMEKLYAYGRYLLICSTSDRDTLPCHLTGLFNGTWQCFWAFYMYNVNFEMIYWQTLTGNLPGFLRLALDYTEAMVPDFRENARKLFGCRGILINSVNTPESGLSKCPAPHILNWTGGAAWFAQHFWDYYRFTGDEDYLRRHALPFMYEAALFYEDFAVENPDGYYDLYPAVSPENTPANIKAIANGREIETAKNAAMEFALLKELLTNLLEGCRITGLYPEKQQIWREMLQKVRPYMVGEDGAVKEWSDPFYEDNHRHRHHSHLYPVFPGCEITREDPLYPAFEKAEELRLQQGITDQSSWSMVFMAGIAARMERGDFALSLLETISRTCLMNNFLTVHNDWRRMGPIACADFRVAPFQIDGNTGIPAAVNEMLLQSQQEDLFVLPALPQQWPEGHITGLLARGNIRCDIFWNGEEGKAVFYSSAPCRKEICLGSGFRFKDGSDRRTETIGSRTTVRFTR